MNGGGGEKTGEQRREKENSAFGVTPVDLPIKAEETKRPLPEKGLH